MATKRAGVLRIGTSNIVLPGNKQSFPPEFRNRSRLCYYSSLFNTLEVNSSFYKIPMPSTFERWSTEAGEDFQFSIKLFKEITHAKELKIVSGDIDRFLSAVESLGTKKGCLLVQFPGKITLDYYRQVEEMLNHIRQYPAGTPWRIAVEFRNDSWYIAEVNELLDHCGASLVLHDIPKGKNAATVNRKADFIYIRYHGPTGNYRGSYSNEFLEKEWKKISGWLKKGKDVYAYFNNTIGEAFENAIALKRISSVHK